MQTVLSAYDFAQATPCGVPFSGTREAWAAALRKLADAVENDNSPVLPRDVQVTTKAEVDEFVFTELRLTYSEKDTSK